MCKSNTTEHEKVLSGWYLERKQQLETSLASTVKNGDMVNSRNPFVIFCRDWGFWLMQLIPSIRRKILLGARAYGPIQYTYLPGMAFLPELGGGCSFAQTFCIELLGKKRYGDVQLTDDVVFSPEKTKLFQIVVLLDSLTQTVDADKAIRGLDAISSHLSPTEATMFLRRETMDETVDEIGTHRVFRTATAEEFSNSELCKGRPEPRGYVEGAMWHGVRNKRFVIVRHDRFVFAACDNREELELAAGRIEKLFPSQNQGLKL